MKKIRLPYQLFLVAVFLLSFTHLSLQGQVVSADPPLPSPGNPVTITFNAAGTPLEGYTGDVYAHTGLILEGNPSWTHVIGSWGSNTTQPQLTRIATDLYELEITPSIREFYDASPDVVIQQMAFVFRAAEESPQSQDLFVEVAPDGLALVILSPEGMQPIYEIDDAVSLQAAANNASSLTLYVNEDSITSTTGEPLVYEWIATDFGRFDVRFVARDDQNELEAVTYFYVRSETPVAAMPEGMIPGVNYLDESSATLVLHDPPALKEFVFLIGDFNNWELSDESLMNQTPDGTHYWITLTGLNPDTEYAYQYYIDGELRLADPYTHKVLDPGMDQWIEESVYPGLKEYPHGETEGIVSILHTNWSDYQWTTTDFAAPPAEDMVIYELLIRDFVDTDAIKTVMDSLDYLQSLGVNAIELMPINEFEGNDSWGYNPAFYFAADKAYGPWDDYKAFVDACHQRGIAVIIDMVLNHSFGQSPLVKMYFDPQAGTWGQPMSENPWYNDVCPHEPWCWGYDFDHLSPYTQDFVDRVNTFWLEELQVDGFRFDFTKGFTNVQTGNQGSNYDASRIAILKRMSDEIWQVNPDAYVILEHFAANDEEKELADYGMMIWGNLNHAYTEASMGWVETSNFSGASYQQRGYNNPHLVAYMESHDEERMMFKNLEYGNSTNPEHDVKEMEVALGRSELAAVFFFGIPGPKMIWQFGELGYDYSINNCPDGTIDPDCRTSRKPIEWDYYDDWRRKNLYDIYSLMANLKTSQEVFATEDFSLVAGGQMKRIHLNHETNNVTILGNFGVTQGEITPNFQQTGTWYEYFTGQEISVEDVAAPLVLEPGEYRLYSTVAFPDHGLPLDNSQPAMTEQLRVYPNPSAQGFWFETSTLTEDAHLEIFNIQGQVIWSERSETSSGSTLYWNGHSHQGQNAPLGLYFYRVTAGEKTFSGKIMVK
ncbi:MAG: alpha-amylase family glycosyl hydrolase [Bacteroidales bacterium]